MQASTRVGAGRRAPMAMEDGVRLGALGRVGIPLVLWMTLGAACILDRKPQTGQEAEVMEVDPVADDVPIQTNTGPDTPSDADNDPPNMSVDVGSDVSMVIDTSEPNPPCDCMDAAPCEDVSKQDSPTKLDSFVNVALTQGR